MTNRNDIDHTAEKNRSYARRVRRGQTVTLARDVYGCVWDEGMKNVIDRPLAPKGAKVVVTSESNAGFRGIEFSFTYNGQRGWHGVSTGAIR